MVEDNVLYTDGHGVKVTTNELITTKSHYLLNGITRVQMFLFRANKAPAIVLMLLGLAAAILGILDLIPASTTNNQPDTSGIIVNNTILSINDIIAIAGGILLLIGIIWMASTHDRYSVRITTAEGDKDVVVSPKRDYISQIVDAVSVAMPPKVL